MVRAVEEFHGLAHALERVGTVQGVSFVNDSKATNIVSATRAIESRLQQTIHQRRVVDTAC